MRLGKTKEGQVELYAPAMYWRVSPATRELLTNGCGTGGLIGLLVPDTIYGLPVHRACDIHDFMYRIGETEKDKEEADIAFLNNLLRIIEARTRWKILLELRVCRARTYYRAVRDLGGPAFWSGKNEPETVCPVPA
jgi:hypothetical protein